MKLQDLVGLHELTAVEMAKVQVSYTSDGDITTKNEDCLFFTLDGKTYSVLEDTEDMYNNYADSIKVYEGEVSNTFAPIQVIFRQREFEVDDADFIEDIEWMQEKIEQYEVYELVNAETNELIFIVGTDYTNYHAESIMYLRGHNYNRAKQL